jgi:hypothetical protein
MISTHLHQAPRVLRILHVETDTVCPVSRALYHSSPKTSRLSVRGDWECFIEMTAADYMQTPSQRKCLQDYIIQPVKFIGR